MARDSVMARTVLAILVSPLPAPAFYYLCVVFLQDNGLEFAFANLGMVYLLGLPLAYLAMLVIGMPLHFLSTWRQWNSILWYLFGGGIAGLAVWLFVSRLSDLGYYAMTLVYLAPAGAISGALFFMILKAR